MDIKIKVCGMKYHENIMDVADLHPDYIGFIFYERSKRFVGEDLEPLTTVLLNKSIEKVGVFVNHSINFIEDAINKFDLNLLQLHGDETVEQCKELSFKGYKIIKAFQIDKNFDFKSIEPYKKHVDYFLFDTKSEDYGGTGKKYDWNILKEYDNDVPIFLSGGLDMDSIEEIKKITHLNIHALDINSKFEVEAGRKDLKKVKLFIERVRNEILS
jgi:phosphoribosylanthranilate isomerase